MTLLADAFNLFNLKRVIDYDSFVDQSFDVLNPDYGQPVSSWWRVPAFQAPFALRLGPLRVLITRRRIYNGPAHHRRSIVFLRTP